MAINYVDGKYVDEKGIVRLDPVVYKDWQIAEEAEKTLPSVDFFREKLGLLPEEIIPYGKTPKIDFIKVMKRLENKPDGKFIEVTAVTPTPFGEGKSTVSLGLIEGLGYIGKNAGGALRQPSGGPTMNVKGTAAGGGNALLMPATSTFLNSNSMAQLPKPLRKSTTKAMRAPTLPTRANSSASASVSPQKQAPSKISPSRNKIDISHQGEEKLHTTAKKLPKKRCIQAIIITLR